MEVGGPHDANEEQGIAQDSAALPGAWTTNVVVVQIRRTDNGSLGDTQDQVGRLHHDTKCGDCNKVAWPPAFQMGLQVPPLAPAKVQGVLRQVCKGGKQHSKLQGVRKQHSCFRYDEPEETRQQDRPTSGTDYEWQADQRTHRRVGDWSGDRAGTLRGNTLSIQKRAGGRWWLSASFIITEHNWPSRHGDNGLAGTTWQLRWWAALAN